jgi:hypothetical protein
LEDTTTKPKPKPKVTPGTKPSKPKTPYQPGVIGKDGFAEVTAVFDTNTGKYSAKVMREAPFCSGGSHISDGSIVVAGGDFGKDQKGITNGLRSVRIFANNKWVTKQPKLSSPRWYPTQVALPDGMRTLILGGSTRAMEGKNVPSGEVYDARTNTMTNSQNISALKMNGVLYPTAFLLPWKSSTNVANIFLFNRQGGSIINVNDKGTIGEYKRLPNIPLQDISAATSSSGSPVMLMLTPETQYTPKIIMFGGYYTTKTDCLCDRPSHHYAFTMNVGKTIVDQNKINWVTETMPTARSMASCVLLPNGKILIVNGVKTGLDTLSRDPVLSAWLYNPKASLGSRFRTIGASKIPRFYHNSAILLPDGSVFIGGSETRPCDAGCPLGGPDKYKYEYMSEKFYPPYYYNKHRPEITYISQENLSMGENVSINYKGTSTAAVLVRPGAVTHSNDMGQRAIKLQVVTNNPSKKTMTVKMPPKGGVVAPPGYYMLFVLNGDNPCKKARWNKLS